MRCPPALLHALLVITFFCVTNHASAQILDVCYKDGCGPNSTAQYEYTQVQCVRTGTSPLGEPIYGVQNGTYRGHPSSSLLFQNTPPNFLAACGSGHCGDPSGFGVSPDCTGGEGSEGGECPGGQPRAGSCSGPCSCEAYENECCGSVPPGCKAELGCPIGGTPTATPAPSPYCTLACPGQPLTEDNDPTGGGTVVDAPGNAAVAGASTLLAQVSVGGGGSSGAGGISEHQCGPVSGIGPDKSGANVAFGSLEGEIEFHGYNSFSCQSLYTCDPDTPETCPSPTVVGGSTSADAGTISKYVLGAASDDPQFNTTPLGKVLGAATQLLAQTNPGGGTGTGTGGSPSGHTTWTKEVSMNRLSGSEPRVYSYSAQASTGQSCTCKVILGCQNSQQASPNSEEMEIGVCEDQCNFTFDEDSLMPEALIPANITVDANSGFEFNVTMDFDDGAPPHTITGQSNISNPFMDAGTYDVTMTCQNPGRNSKTCTRRLNVYCTGSNPEELPTPTPAAPGAWAKVKDASVVSRQSMNNPVPTGAVAYDASDIGSCSLTQPSSIACFNIGQAGVVSVNGNTAEFGTGVSERGWLRADGGYQTNSLYSPATFIEYVRARKDINEVASLAIPGLEADIINLVDAPTAVVINNNNLSNLSNSGTYGVVLVVDGDLVIDMASDAEQTFNPTNQSILIVVNGDLQISSATTELNGIFIANSIDYAYDAAPTTTTPLKVNGSISALQVTTACAEKRQRDDNELQPSCFVTFDFANHFAPLIDLLGTRTYEWSELTN